jgi:hypothetical protein
MPGNGLKQKKVLSEISSHLLTAWMEYKRVPLRMKAPYTGPPTLI